jgi:hypothetical protein
VLPISVATWNFLFINNYKLKLKEEKPGKQIIGTTRKTICQNSYTVDIFSGEPGESAQLRFALKNFGRISSDLGEFRPLFSRRIC